MSTLQQVLKLARSKVGYVERSNNGSEFGDWLGYRNQPWCASFVSWVFAQAGMPIPAKTSQGFAYCPDGVNYFKRAQRFFGSPKVGDVVFYGYNGWAEHCGIVESINGSEFTAIEGNTSLSNQTNGGSVMRRTRFLNSWVVGFGRPTYESPMVGESGPEPVVLGSPTQVLDTNSVEVMVSNLPVVKRGSTGQHVLIAQSLLVANGRKVAIDGDFGPDTDAKLRDFQGATSLDVDGVCGPRTWRRLLCI